MSVYLELRCNECEFKTSAGRDGLGAIASEEHVKATGHDMRLVSEYDDEMIAEMEAEDM